MAGYIKLYRSCRMNPLWKDKPFSKWQAFEDLLLSAAYEPNDVLIKNQIVHLERTQLIRATHTLAHDWGWSVKKVRGFINLLETQKMVTAKGTPQGTLITIENYNIYQSDGRAEDTEEGQAKGKQRASKGRAKGNKEEIKEVKEIKEPKETNKLYAELHPDLIKTLMDFEEMRIKKKNEMTDAARKILLNKLVKLTGGDTQKCIALLEESIERGWQSVFPPKENKSRDNKKSLDELIESGVLDE